MFIRKSSNKYGLFRYGGVAEGKNLEVRVGSIPLGTSPDNIAAEILEDLTPKELRIVKEELAKAQGEIWKSKMTAVVEDLNDLTSALDTGLLDINSLAALSKAASTFVKRSRRVLPLKQPGADQSASS